MTRPLPGSRFLPRGLSLLYEDADVLVVDKPPGLLTMGNASERERTVYVALTDYVRKGQAKSRKRVFIVHRLDRETSGLLVFARTEEAKRALQEGWDETSKTYIAVVHGRVEKDEGVITSWLVENSAFVVFSTQDTTKGKQARTGYRVLHRTAHRSLIELDLFTGRKHQIRVHMADLGHALLGDTRYGKAKDPVKRLALHAHTLAFTHPRTGERLEFLAPVTGELLQMTGKLPGGVLRMLQQGRRGEEASEVAERNPTGCRS